MAHCWGIFVGSHYKGDSFRICWEETVIIEEFL